MTPSPWLVNIAGGYLLSRCLLVVRELGVANTRLTRRRGPLANWPQHPACGQMRSSVSRAHTNPGYRRMREPETLTPVALPAEPSPKLEQLIRGLFSTYVVHAAAQLDIADLLATGPLTVEELARRSGTCIEPLRRLLRGLVMFGLICERDDELLELTEVGAGLRSDAPGDQRTWALLFGHEMMGRAWGNLSHVLKNEEIPFDRVFGMSFFDYLEVHPDAADLFNRAMRARSRDEHAAVLGAYDFGPYHRIVDVGGGTGELLRAICARCPSTEGVVFDLAGAKRAAEETFELAGLQSRCRFVAGNFFESSPPEGDLIVLSRVLHDWDDARALTILNNCARATPRGGRMLIMDLIRAPEAAPRTDPLSVALDLQILATLGGRERTQDELLALLEAANLTLLRSVPTSTGVWLSEATHASRTRGSTGALKEVWVFDCCGPYRSGSDWCDTQA
jgi:ubiquinone/menaquinone biosynthesis C-methylase UbiE